VRTEAIRAARAVQRREGFGGGKAEGVRRAVEGLGERQAARRRRGEQRAEVVGNDARDVGVDDEDATEPDACQAGLHRRALAAARIGDDFGTGIESGGRALLVGGDDAGAADRGGRGEDVAEHRVRERPADAP